MSSQFEKISNNKYYSLFVVVFFTIFIIVEYNQGDEIPFAFLGLLLMFIPKTMYLFNKDLKNNNLFSLFHKTFDYAGKGVIIFFAIQVVYKLCKLNGYL
tara:strand:- start:2674 stop:2970 length:297 start_codon:yes stop_codon:yes gene_type:complete